MSPLEVLSDTTLKASCLCGRSKHEITLPTDKLPLPAYICHCNSCRHLTGTLCFSVVFLPAHYSPSPGFLDSLQAYVFTQKITYYSCGTCGTKMLASTRTDLASAANASNWCVSTGTLEIADGVFEVKAHEHVQDTLDGGFADFLPSVAGKVIPRWPGRPGAGEELPIPWHASALPQNKPRTTGLLNAHCHCRTLNFWISRPSEQSAQARAMWPDALVPYETTQALPADTETWWLRASNTKFFASTCVCPSCRLASGMEWVEFAFIPACNLWADKEGSKPLVFNQMPGVRVYESSKGVRRFFCGTCGALAFWDGEERPMVKDVGVGLLEAEEGARAENWLEWGCGRVSFAELGRKRASALTESLEDGLKRFEERQGRVHRRVDA